MSSVFTTQNNSPRRYKDYNIKSLVSYLDQQAISSRTVQIKKIKEDRKVHLSCTQMNYKPQQNKPLFNNKTKDGQLFETVTKLIPYVFIPKYKNNTFIMPNRVFQKGKAGKRFHIKMKDSDIYSFRDSQTQSINKLLNKEEKIKIIKNRKMEELNRILDRDNGCKRAQKFKQHLRTRKYITPTSITSQIFSQCEPMLEPKQQQTIEIKKKVLDRTFTKNKWRPTSRGSHVFSSTVASNFTTKFSDLQCSMR